MRASTRLLTNHPLAGWVVYAAFTALFVCIGNKIMGNGTLTLSWQKAIVASPTCTGGGVPSHLKTKRVSDKGVIAYKLSDELKNTETFDRFQKRKLILDRACSVSRKVLSSKNMNHEQRVTLQHAINNVDQKLDVESRYCVPRLADKTQKQEHFFNDTFKFSVCLPTKTGCTNWQRGLVSLVKLGAKTPEELTDGEIFYDLDRYPKIGMTAEREKRASHNGYLTMINVRHPLSRLLSAWRDKFRKGHPWMRIIEPKFGKFLEKLERKDMSLEMFEYSFEAFLELAAASDSDFMRDQHWRSMTFHCGPCNNEYEFIVHQEHGSEEQEFILKAMEVEDQTHIPGKYTTALKSYDEMLENFRGISEFVIKELYRIYYSDFAFFGYELDEFLAVAKKDDPNDSFHKIRQWARVSLTKKFFPYREKFHEGECDETYQDPDYNEVPQ